MAEIEPTRAVVEAGETYDGKLIPTEQAEIDRPVRVHEGATVEGSVYGASVELTDGAVEGSVMASDGVDLDGGVVDGEVGTPGKVTGSDATVYGTVTGKRVRLQSAVVLGNVVGTDVILEDCLVVGLVVAERKLALEGTLCYTFKGHGETVLDDATVVLPQAILEGEVGFESPVTVAGLGELETAEEGLPTMDDSDIVEVEGQTYLSLTPRILNLQAVSDRLDELESTLSTVAVASDGDGRPDPTALLDALDVDEAQYPAAI